MSDHIIVSQQSFTEEVAAMLNVCFEGEISSDGKGILVRLCNGQCFRVECRRFSGSRAPFCRSGRSRKAPPARSART